MAITLRARSVELLASLGSCAKKIRQQAVYLQQLKLGQYRRMVARVLGFTRQLVNEAACDGWLECIIECIARQDVINAQAEIPAKRKLTVIHG